MEIEPIAIIHNDYTDKFAIPRQSGIAGSIQSEIHFLGAYNDESAVRGIEDFSHLWLIWGFSKNYRQEHSLTVRPPRLGGNERIGVFASRAPFRPNNLGLSSVKLEGVKTIKNAPVLVVSGADLMDSTPIYDIKPYIPFTDCHTDAAGGFIDKYDFNILKVNIDENLLADFSEEQIITLKEILSNDSRPAYHYDSDRVYGFRFAGKEIKFTVKDNELSVVSIEDE